MSVGAPGGTPAIPTVIHLIPYDWPGGVEVAAATVAPGRYGSFTFDKLFLASKTPGVRETIAPENDPRAFLRAFATLVRRRPDLLVLSLWRSCLVGLAVKLVRPRTRLVLFLHNSENAHAIDAVVTRLTARFADAIWGDSASTAALRLAAPVRPISFLTERIAPCTAMAPSPRFIFWGRLHPRKQLPRAIALFARIRSNHPDARLTIVGPDGGEEARLKTLVAGLGLDADVTFVGATDHAAIAQLSAGHSFFLQTSRAEGMALSAVEAMQLGLVPVVTPVGEVAAYVKDDVNGIWVTHDEETVARIERMLADPTRFASLRARAVEAWANQPLYRDEFLAACADVLARR